MRSLLVRVRGPRVVERMSVEGGWEGGMNVPWPLGEGMSGGAVELGGGGEGGGEVEEGCA